KDRAWKHPPQRPHERRHIRDIVADGVAEHSPGRPWPRSADHVAGKGWRHPTEVRRCSHRITKDGRRGAPIQTEDAARASTPYEARADLFRPQLQCGQAWVYEPPR